MASHSSTQEQPHYPHVSQQPPGEPMAYQTRPRGYSSSSQTQYNQQQQPWDPSHGAVQQAYPPRDQQAYPQSSHLAPSDALMPYTPHNQQQQLQPYDESYNQQQPFDEPTYAHRPSHHRSHKSSASHHSKHSHMSQEAERELEYRPSLGDSIFGMFKWISGVLDSKRK